MKNKSAVEWFFGQSLELTLQLSKRRISHRTWELEMVKISEQAKEMEKQQIINAFKSGDCNGTFETINAEQYYNETFKNK
jgi:hypothetical protein